MRNKHRCEKCGFSATTTKHHVLPRRWWPENNDEIITLCHTHHWEIEMLLTACECGTNGKRIKLTESQYRAITRWFTRRSR